MVQEQAKKRQRTCIGCGKQADKVELHRIVRKPDGGIAFDASGRMAGRGAYVCSARCLENAVGKRKLQRALRCELQEDQVRSFIESALEALGEKVR